MTTKHSPLSTLRARADKIASTLKAAERGEKIDARFAEKIEAARAKESFKVGIVMDDKVIIIETPWATIRSTDEAGLSEYMLRQMQEARDTVN
ncbi:hypothetical protein [Phenylobacterium sp.]|jgi:hypothetical protein|uniref:hypothetical protein n=1 Tax=Phenylobacterium sp. TaxID=1871053 RepID=UPI002F405B9E